MKSLTAVCQTGASMPAMKPNSGRVSRPPHHRGDGENAEMKMYLSKLKDLVPFMPKNRKLSKLEIIQHVIDYICDLQTELEAHPEINNFDAATALNFIPGNGGITGNNNNNSNLLNSLITSQNIDTTNGADIIATPVEDVEMTDRLTTTTPTTTSTIADAATTPATTNSHDQEQQQSSRIQQSSPAGVSIVKKQRQPLVDRQTPNKILSLVSAMSSSAAIMSLSSAITAAAAAASATATATTTSSATTTMPTATSTIAIDSTEQIEEKSQEIEETLQATALQNATETTTIDIMSLVTKINRHLEDSTC